MPLYTVTTPDGLLSAQQRDAIAAELVRIHTTAMNVPAVHSVFPTCPGSHAYVATERSPVSSIVGASAPVIRPLVIHAAARSLVRFASAPL